MSTEAVNKVDDSLKIEIDGQEFSAAKGQMIIEVADAAGIEIPRFCYHEKLSIAANCRICLVDVEKSPKPLPACATPVMDGMKIFTQSKRAVDSQRNVMEFLLINHPLDCPICDQGGECELQDVAMGYGRGISRFTEQKRVVPSKNIGTLIATDMTRCIHCTRCIRFLDEIAGTNELGGIGRGDRTSIETFISRSIDSELSGNVIDVCPVGALTNKPFRFKARAWELRAHEMVSTHDCLGGNAWYHVYQGKIERAVPRANEEINETWISDRDRFAFLGMYSEDRLLSPATGGKSGKREISWDTALELGAEKLAAALETDPASVRALISDGSSNEEFYALGKLLRDSGCSNIDHRLRCVDFSDQGKAQAVPGMNSTLAEIAAADAVLIVGSRIRHEQPLLGHRVRQAWLGGAAIAQINPVAYRQHFETAVQSTVKPSQTAAVMQAVLDNKGDGAEIAALLRDAKQPVLIVGDLAASSKHAAIIRKLAAAISDKYGVALNIMPQGANGLGAFKYGALPDAGTDTQSMLQQSSGLLILHGIDIDGDALASASLLKAMAAADYVIALASHASDSLRSSADLILPLAVSGEFSGSYSNAMGQEQRTRACVKPAGEAKPGWSIWRAMAEKAGNDALEFTDLDGLRTHLGEVSALALDDTAYEPAADNSPADGLERVAEQAVYATSASVRRSEPLQKSVLGQVNAVSIHPDDAGKFLTADNAQANVVQGEFSVEMTVTLDASVARGAILMPSGISETLGFGALENIRLEALD